MLDNTLFMSSGMGHGDRHNLPDTGLIAKNY